MRVKENKKCCALCKYWDDTTQEHISPAPGKTTDWEIDNRAIKTCRKSKQARQSIDACPYFSSKVFIEKTLPANQKTKIDYDDDDYDDDYDDDDYDDGDDTGEKELTEPKPTKPNKPKPKPQSNNIDKLLINILKLFFKPKNVFTILVVLLCAFSMYLAIESYIGALIGGISCFIVIKVLNNKLIKTAIIIFLATSAFTFRLATEIYNIAVESTKKYEVELIYDVGNVQTIKVRSNQTIEFPNDTKEGHTLIGWYLDYQYDNEWFLTDTVNENVTLYAKWQINSYTISFITGNDTVIPDIIKEYNQPVTIPNIGEKTGYTFDGWYEDAGLTNKFTANLIPARNVVLYSKWIPKSFIITFDVNGGVIESTSLSVRYNETYSLFIPSKKGYAFAGWKKLDGNEFANAGIWALLDNMTLEATWTKEEYSISYILNNGTDNSSNPILYNIDTNDVTLIAPTRVGYTFDGWYTEATFQNQIINLNDKAENLILHAKWKATSYTITYNPNGGQMSNYNQVVKYEESYSLIIPTRNGYTFNGWMLESEVFANTGTWNKINNIALEATWTRDQYTITYYLADGTNNASNPNSYNVDDNIELLNPTRSGYTFDGWYTEATFQNLITALNGNTGNKNLYAKWSLTQCTVTFNSNGGSDVASKTVNQNLTITKPTNPTKRGYVFDGWYVDSTFTTLWDFTNDIVTSNITLYAKWSDFTYSISNDEVTITGLAQYSTIRNLVLPNQINGLPVTYIGSNAFKDNSILETVIIPDSVITIGNHAFYRTISLSTVVVGNGVETIGESAFESSNVISVTIGNNVKIINKSAFSSCVKLETINLPESLHTIGSAVFDYCENLTNIILPKGLQEIGFHAFYGCKKLTNIIIYKDVIKIGERAFYNSPNLTIHCEVASKPAGWESSWRGSGISIIWNYQE